MVHSGPLPNRPGVPRTSLHIPVANNNHEPDRARVIMLKGSAGCLLSCQGVLWRPPGRAAGADDTPYRFLDPPLRKTFFSPGKIPSS